MSYPKPDCPFHWLDFFSFSQRRLSLGRFSLSVYIGHFFYFIIMFPYFPYVSHIIQCVVILLFTSTLCISPTHSKLWLAYIFFFCFFYAFFLFAIFCFIFSYSWVPPCYAPKWNYFYFTLSWPPHFCYVFIQIMNFQDVMLHFLMATLKFHLYMWFSDTWLLYT